MTTSFVVTLFVLSYFASTCAEASPNANRESKFEICSSRKYPLSQRHSQKPGAAPTRPPAHPVLQCCGVWL